jgi:hypothetical protein
MQLFNAKIFLEYLSIISEYLYMLYYSARGYFIATIMLFMVSAYVLTLLEGVPVIGSQSYTHI